MAARQATEAQERAEAQIAATATLNDFVGAGADISGSLGKALGRSAEAAEGLSRASMAAAVGFAVSDVIAAARTRSPDKAFDAGFSMAALGGSLIDPMFGAGMVLGGIAGKLVPSPPSAFQQEMASVGPKCTPQ
jgi:hypothetical protein